MGYTEGKHDDPADTKDRLVRIGTKYQATAPNVADGDNAYLLVDSAGRVILVGPAASDAPELGNPVQIGGSVDDTSPAAAAEGDVRRIRVTPEGNLIVELYKDNSPVDTDSQTHLGIVVKGQNNTNNANNGLEVNARLAGYAPDGAWDRIRTLQNSAPGLGVLAAAPYTPGASEVSSVRGTIGSTTRATLLTPTSGKKVRIISVEVTGQDATAHNVEVYFAAGANITTTAGKEICEPLVDLTDAPNYREAYPDGGGPVGAADDVISIRCSHHRFHRTHKVSRGVTMKVLSATDYGYRKVICVCMNPDDPEYAHPGGSPHQDLTSVDAKGVVTPDLQAGSECHACRSNWDVRELVWTGDELYVQEEDQERRLKTNTELLDEISAQLQPAPTPAQMSELINRTLT